MSFDLQQYAQTLSELTRAESPFVVVTIVSLRGSAPQVAGAKAIVSHEGLRAGTVGGGKVEARAIEHAQRLLADPRSPSCEMMTWNLQTDVGMTCGGEVRLFFELCQQNSWIIAIFGAGHVAQSLIPLLLPLNCRIVCADTRSSWLGRLVDHAKLKKICHEDLTSLVSDLPTHAFCVLMTQGHATDLPILAEILKTRQPPYLGVIGSRQKSAALRRSLREMGLSDAAIRSFHCPMGFPIGNNTPPEIAISIAAQLLQFRDAPNPAPNPDDSDNLATGPL
ncbi:MAG: xanthine dehydrogenase accessory protein XdhC [Pirellulaceae bacterium]|nr:xanthine dehydrogenase accessory protein XdhC [Planctomycetales bacterium]